MAPTLAPTCPALDRTRRFVHPHRALSRCSVVRVAAFNNASTPAPKAPGTTAWTEHVAALPPADLAAALLEGSPEAEPRLYDAVAQRIARSPDDFDARSLAEMLRACSSSSSSSSGAGQQQQGQQQAQQQGQQGQRGRSSRDLIAICSAVLTAKMDELPAAALAGLACSCAALELRATDMLAALCARARQPDVLPHLSPPDLLALLAALAALGHRSPALFQDAAEALAPALAPGGALGPEQAAQAVWAMAAEGQYHRQLFDNAGLMLMDRLRGLDAGTMARIVWAYATIRSADESHRALWDRDLFDGIAYVCLERGVASFPTRALVTLLWAFASIPHYDKPLFDALCTALTPQLRAGRCGAAELVFVARAVTRVGHGNTGLMAALGDAALASLEQLTGDDLTTIAMAFPAAKAYSEPFFKHLVSDAQRRPVFFGQVALLDVIRLISKVQHRDPDYYGPALQVLLDHVHQAFLDAPVPVEKACCGPAA